MKASNLLLTFEGNQLYKKQHSTIFFQVHKTVCIFFRTRKKTIVYFSFKAIRYKKIFSTHSPLFFRREKDEVIHSDGGGVPTNTCTVSHLKINQSINKLIEQSINKRLWSIQSINQSIIDNLVRPLTANQLINKRWWWCVDVYQLGHSPNS